MISTIETIQTRVSEIEYVFLPNIGHDSNLIKEDIDEIVKFKDQFDLICTQIDNVGSLVSRVKLDLNKLEKQIENAEEELDIPPKNPTLNFLINMNPFLKLKSQQGTNIGLSGNYEGPDIFKTTDYFTETQSQM